MRSLSLILLSLPLLANAAAPVVQSSDAQTFDGASTTHSVDLTGIGTISSGDLLQAMIFGRTGDLHVLSLGTWTEVGQNLFGSRVVAVYETTATGSEGSSITLTWDAASSAVVYLRRITGHDSATPSEVTFATGASATPDPASITPAGGSDDYLYRAGCMWRENETASAYPAGYSGGLTVIASSLTIGSADAYKETTASSSEDPGTFTRASTNVWNCGTVATYPSAATPAPAFDSGPTLSSAGETNIILDYNADAVADNIQCMLTDTAASAPTAAAIEAQTGSHGYATEASTGAADTLTVSATDTPEFPLYDAHCALEEGTSNYSTVATVSDVAMTAPTGFQFVAITSIGVGSPCEDFNAAAAPDIASGDYLLAPTTVSPGGGVDDTLTIGADCQFEYDADNLAQQRALNVDVYDASVGDWHADGIDAYFNNTVPVCDEGLNVFVYDQDVAIDDYDLNISCTDDDTGDTLDFTVTTGTLPTGLALGGTGNATLSGTPTVETETGAAVTFTATDDATDTDTLDSLIYVVDTATVPNYVGETVSSVSAVHAAAFPWQIDSLDLTLNFACDATAPADEIFAQDPAAASEIEPFEQVTVTASTGSCGSKTSNYGRRRVQ